MQSNLGGGPFIDKVHEQMKSAIDAQKDDKKQQATETAVPKYVHYSAHDTTIQSIFSTLNMSDNYKALQLGPKYGAQIVFELSQQGDEYFVTFLYRDVFDGEFRAYKLPKYCTSDVCTWNEFTRYITEVSTVPIDSWCHRCNSNRKVGTCALIVVQEPQHHRTALIITVALLVMTLLIVTPVTCVLATRRCTLARKDTSNISERNSLLAVNDRYRRH
ncbi:Histidine phosphatase superfamily (branch 2) [compost metagenome]